MKKILFAAPKHFGLYKSIISELEKLDYEVTSICISDIVQYKGLKDQFKKILFKNILGNKNYKNQLRLQHQEEELLPILDNYTTNYFDLVFFIRPDFYATKVIHKALEKSTHNFAYHWDGLDRYPNTFDKIALFDKYYVFDKNDIIKHQKKYPNLEFTTNFFFRENFITSQTISKKKGFFYLGAYEEKRFNFLKRLNSLVDSQEFAKEFRIWNCNSEIIQEMGEDKSFIFFNQLIDYNDMIQLSSQYEIIVDLMVNEHMGLSFRFFEALQFEQKLITTNPEAKKFDFYHPDNILVLNKETKKEEITNFINTPYHKIDSSIVDTYSFHNWLKQKK